jgi:hypothetical protein
MNCLQCQQLLQDRLDGLPPTDTAEMNRHLAACPDCRRTHGAVGRLEEGLRLLAPPAPPARLADRIVTAVRSEQGRRRRVRRIVRVALAVAASLLLVLTLADHRRLGPVRFPPPPRDNPGAPVVHEQRPSLRERVAEASTAVVDLAGRTADQTVGQSRLLLPVVMATPPLETPADPLSPMETPMRSLREAGQGVSSGLEPVADSARRVFDLVLREIPAVGSDGKPGF